MDKILFIDNNKIVADLVTEKLQNDVKFEIIKVSLYKELKKVLNKYKFFIAVVDLNLKDCKKDDIINLIKSESIPIILFSEEISENDINKYDILSFIRKDSSESIKDVAVIINRIKNHFNKIILIVDDSRVYRAMYFDLLNKRGFKVLEATNGLEALSVLEQHQGVELILTDYNMPNLDGLGLLKEIRKKYSSSEKKVIVISNEEDTKVTSKFLRHGADDYIKKPFSDDEFFGRVYINLDNLISIVKINSQLKEIQNKNDELIRSQVLLNEYKRAVDAGNIVSKTNINGVITFVNDEFCKVSGYSKEELIGQMHNIIRHPDNPKYIFKELWETILDKKIHKGIVKNRKKDGSEYFVDTVIVPILDINSNISEFISIRKEVTQLIKQKQKIREQTTDFLTKRPNRVRLLEDLKLIKGELSLAILNIDRFKEINDFYGYSIGDRLLLELSEKIKTIVSKKNLKIYRIGADEFVFLSNSIKGENFIKLIISIRQHIISEAFICEAQNVYINVTLGVAFGKKEQLLINANIAFQRAKNLRKDFEIFDDALEISKQYKENIKWIEKIKKAIAEDKIVPFFQPIVNNENGKIEKYESLVRLIDSDDNDKIISPFFFLDISKKARLYSQITRIMIEKSIKIFKDSYYEFSINLSIEDILDESIVNFLKEKLEDTKLAKRVVFEIVESEEIENFEAIKKFIDYVKNLGCKIAIDDFGTGYSNFNYIIELNPDYLKIDGSLIKTIDKNENLEKVVDTINRFAKYQNIKTIAEFIHSKEVYEKVKNLNITYSQGYHLGEPNNKLKETN